MAMISRESIEEVLIRTDIQSLVSNYVTLKRAGSNLRGLCPFHSEKSPSFTVYPADNSFYCFGCGAGGDQISFAMRMENLDYPDAIEFLAKRAGVKLVETGSGYTNEPKYDKARFYAMNIDAARFFSHYLFSDDPEAKSALAYFTEKRKLSIATIKHFGLGFAPDSFDKFTQYMMMSKGYTKEELVVGYLCRQREGGGGVYDAFRNRVMFPVIDVAGNVIAFGGRVMDDSKPKYLNSSDTPVFKKSRNLFALNFARLASQQSIVLCEGYMDVIALHAAGITNAVATLGTAITSEQARLLSRYTKKVIISYDADEAGQKATKRAIDLLEEVGLDVSVLVIPGAKDPDEYIKTYGVEKFRELIGASKSRFDYTIDGILSKYDISLPQDKIDAVEEAENLISTIYSAAERDVYIQNIALKFSLSASGIKSDVERIIQKRERSKKRNEGRLIHESSVGYSDKINPDFIKAPALARNEETVIALLLLYPEHRKKVFGEGLLSSQDFFTDLNRRIFEYIKICYEKEDDRFVDINEVFSPDEVGRISKIKISRMEFKQKDENVLLESIDMLKKTREKKKNEAVNSIEGLNELLKKKRNN